MIQASWAQRLHIVHCTHGAPGLLFLKDWQQQRHNWFSSSSSLIFVLHCLFPFGAFSLFSEKSLFCILSSFFFWVFSLFTFACICSFCSSSFTGVSVRMADFLFLFCRTFLLGAAFKKGLTSSGEGKYSVLDVEGPGRGLGTLDGPGKGLGALDGPGRGLGTPWAPWMAQAKDWAPSMALVEDSLWKQVCLSRKMAENLLLQIYLCQAGKFLFF